MNNQIHDRMLAECLAFLASNDVVVDGPIEQIVRYFYSTDKHLDHHDIERYAVMQNLSITFEDIEKTLDLLVEYGFACKKPFSNNKVVYEHLHLDEHHDHMFCMKCGTIIEFFSPKIEELQVVEAKQRGFHAFSHKMQIKGLCDNCFGTVSQKLIPLSMVQSGGAFQVVQMVAGEKSTKRLFDLGIVKGCEGVVIRNGGSGIILNMQGNRIALGRGQGMKVMVSLKN